ncbi:MAG TPA: GNAT family N-acetyltransferase [Clostridia bacterium]|nr:GNAT family N-acetyltransferase [Clostridia bacterium]
MEHKIRWSIEQDAKDLGLIHSQAWRVEYKNIIPDEILDKYTPSRREEHFKNAIIYKTEETAVIESSGKVIGFITLGRSRDSDSTSECGEVWGIYISPDYWRRGFGTILLNWGLRELGLRGFIKVTLWVLEDNKNARSFYEKQGFKFDGTVKEIEIGKQLNEVRYVKDYDGGHQI